MDPEAGKLRYFLKEGNIADAGFKQRATGSIDVARITSLNELEASDKPSRNPSIRGKFPFELGQAPGSGKKVVRLVSDTEGDRALWMDALRAAKNISWNKSGGGGAVQE